MNLGRVNNTKANFVNLCHDLSQALIRAEQEGKISLPYEVELVDDNDKFLGSWSVDEADKWTLTSSDRRIVDAAFPIEVRVTDNSGHDLGMFWSPLSVQ
jgi:hypothetical protein